MTARLLPGPRRGAVSIPASKSQAHRLLLCGALGTDPVRVLCDGLSKDIEATMACLSALGGRAWEEEPGRLCVWPARRDGGTAHLPCGESGSTLRFLLPVVGALGREVVFHMEGRLPQRPLAPLDEVLREHGMTLRQEGALLHCGGRLRAGEYTIAGNVSSQYISGLLFALPLLEGDSTLTVTGAVESEGYITMTEDALRQAGIRFTRRGWQYSLPGGQRCHLPENCRVEGDWSNAAFFLSAGAMSPQGITVGNLSLTSHQGDRAVVDILERFGARVERSESRVTVRCGALRGITIDAAPIPDLIPVLSVVACAARGETRIVNAGRLRLKESDRLESTANLLRALGGDVTEGEDWLTIRGTGELRGGTVDPRNDHRIAMSAAVAACLCSQPVTVEQRQCTQKSYPGFWDDFASLEGEGR